MRHRAWKKCFTLNEIGFKFSIVYYSKKEWVQLRNVRKVFSPSKYSHSRYTIETSHAQDVHVTPSTACEH